MPNRIRCVSIMWDTRSQTNPGPLGNGGMGGMKQGLLSPLLASIPKVSRCWDAGREDQRKERDKCWQMERERRFVQRYQSHWDRIVSTLAAMNSSVGHFARLLIKTWKVSPCIYHIRYAAACQNEWATKAAKQLCKSCLELILSHPDLSSKGSHYCRGTYN